jgi:hypothetical protein
MLEYLTSPRMAFSSEYGVVLGPFPVVEEPEDRIAAKLDPGLKAIAVDA